MSRFRRRISRAERPVQRIVRRHSDAEAQPVVDHALPVSAHVVDYTKTTTYIDCMGRDESDTVYTGVMFQGGANGASSRQWGSPNNILGGLLYMERAKCGYLQSE